MKRCKVGLDGKRKWKEYLARREDLDGKIKDVLDVKRTFRDDLDGKKCKVDLDARKTCRGDLGEKWTCWEDLDGKIKDVLDVKRTFRDDLDEERCRVDMAENFRDASDERTYRGVLVVRMYRGDLDAENICRVVLDGKNCRGVLVVRMYRGDLDAENICRVVLDGKNRRGGLVGRDKVADDTEQGRYGREEDQGRFGRDELLDSSNDLLTEVENNLSEKDSGDIAHADKREVSKHSLEGRNDESSKS